MSSRPVYRMCAQVAPSAEYPRGHARVAIDVTALRSLWQHSPVLGLVLACVPVYAVLRGSLLCSSCGLSAVKINENYYYYIADKLGWPSTNPNQRIFYILQRLSYFRKRVKYFKFGGQVYHSISQPVDNKPSRKGAWSGSSNDFRNLTPHDISLERLKLQTSNFVHRLATRSTNLQMTNCLISGRGQGRVTHSRISHPWNG